MSPVVPALLVAAAWLVLTLPPVAATRLGVRPGGRGPGLVPVACCLAAVTLGVVAAAVVAVGCVVARAASLRRAAARAARDNAAALPDLCRAAAAELRAGAPPAVALTTAAADAPPPVARHVRLLVAGAAAEPPPRGAERLAAVGALWAVAAGAGAGLADGLDRLAAALAAEQRRRAEVDAQLAGPRASAAVLAALPAFGLALGAALGARPLGFLGTPAGLACLVAAAALDAAGVLWVRRLTERAGR